MGNEWYMGDLPQEQSQHRIPGVTPLQGVSSHTDRNEDYTEQRALSPHKAELLKAAPSQQGGQESWNDKQVPVLATGEPSAI